MGISRQAHCQGLQRHAERGRQAEAVVQLVKDKRMRQPTIGTRKLHHLLREPLEHRVSALPRAPLTSASTLQVFP